jgi:hypothetical protein
MIRANVNAARAAAVNSAATNDLCLFPRPSSHAPRLSRSEITKRTHLCSEQSQHIFSLEAFFFSSRMLLWRRLSCLRGLSGTG